MKKVLMIAYPFPPCNASGAHRTLRFVIDGTLFDYQCLAPKEGFQR